MRDLILMKIGGSVCTEKGRGRFRVRTQAIGRIACEIAEARKGREFRLLLVNGAGPFGHVNVVDYDINNGLESPRDFEGFVKTVCDCAYLNHKVSDTLRKKGLPAYPFPSSSVIVQSDKRIVSFCLDVVKGLWQSNPDIIPVMNGTMVSDLKLKGSVVSGDRPIEYLAERLAPKLVVFATDVDGIYTADPRKDRKARLIGSISKDEFSELRFGIEGSSSTDVTGGMLRKIERLVELGTRTLVLNGNVPGRVRDALLGGEVKGTVINP